MLLKRCETGFPFCLATGQEKSCFLTIHGFCHFLLKSEGYVFEILSGKEQIIFIKDIIKKLRCKELSTGAILTEISLAKNNLITVQEFRELYAGDKLMLKVADVYEAYDKGKEKRLLFDFDDLLVETYRLLNFSDELRDKYKAKFKHLLVDEFQDTNPAQMEIMKLLIDEDKSNGSSFFIVGDDWQSIYAFTGATVGNILNFKEMFPESSEFILNINYRSTPQILKACQNLIEHNTRKIEKVLTTHNDDGDEVMVLESSSEEGEALSLVNEITDLVERRGFAHKDIAVLYRANFQSRVVEEVFSNQKIPYHIENGLNFYERSEVKFLISYLRVMADPDSDQADEALLNMINVPNRYIGKKFTQEIEHFAMMRSLHLYRALKSMPIDVPYIRKNVKDLVEFLDPLIEDRETLPPADAVYLVRCAYDYDRYITEDDIPSPDDVKIQNINELQLAATRYKTIQPFLEYVNGFKDEAVHDKNGVSLMTIHKAKGLEFPAVFVIGMVEGIMPTKKGDIEEERRICFVGISRAMKLLYLSYSHTHLGQPAGKSIFIDEIMGTTDRDKPAGEIAA